MSARARRKSPMRAPVCALDREGIADVRELLEDVREHFERAGADGIEWADKVREFLRRDLADAELFVGRTIDARDEAHARVDALESQLEERSDEVLAFCARIERELGTCVHDEAMPIHDLRMLTADLALLFRETTEVPRR